MNTNELNKVLSDEIFKLRAGKVKPDRVNAITRAASQIIAAARLELQYIKVAGVPQATLPFFNNQPAPKKLAAPAKKAKAKG